MNKFIESERKYPPSLIDEQENESESIALFKKIKCPIHSLNIKICCLTCSKDLCIRCLIEHKDNRTHKYKDYSYKKRYSLFSSGKSNKIDNFPMMFSLKHHLKEEFHDQGVKIINETKEKVFEIIEKYFDELTISYKENHSNIEKKSDLLMSTKNEIINSNIHNNEFKESKEIKKITINSQKIHDIPNFLKSCIFIQNGSYSYDRESPIHRKNSENTKKFQINQSNFLKFHDNTAFLHAILPKFNTLFIYDIKSESSLYTAIKKKSPFEIPSSPSSILLYNEYMIIFGGYFNSFSDISLNTYKLDLKSFEIRNLETRTNYSKISNGVFFIDRHIYSIGGKIQNLVRTNLCERFSLETYNWEKIANMKYVRSSPIVTSFNRDLYVFFGINESDEPCKFIEKYNIKDNRWEEISFINEEYWCILNFHRASCLQINEEEILFFGGYKSFSERFEGNDEIIIINMKKKEIFKGNQEKIHPLIQGGSQTCNPLINEKNEIVSLRYLNNELGETIEEFEEMFLATALAENEGVRVLEVINCRHLEKLIKNKKEIGS